MAGLFLVLVAHLAPLTPTARAAEGRRSRTDVRGASPASDRLREPARGRDVRRVERLLRPGPGAEASGWLQLESGPVSFGEVQPGVFNEIPAGLRIRVFAMRDWALRIRPSAALQNQDRGGESVPVSRLSWRTRTGGGWASFSNTASAVVARGGPTGAGGHLIIVDLGLSLDPDDELGSYGCVFQVILESS